ncbi:helix-turn-helix transcriptional regulator [Paenibacillus cisolokensis]|uniref:helix-turn-helix domain-containing protein n=1 Tax=Paenibacillus cisolokensis TaxID=1658519 RepID=UPI003D2D9EA9
MMGLGKKRTKLGTFLDQNKLTQWWLAKESGVGRNTISGLCSGEVEPQERTVQRIVAALRKHGYDVRAGDFWF